MRLETVEKTVDEMLRKKHIFYLTHQNERVEKYERIEKECERINKTNPFSHSSFVSCRRLVTAQSEFVFSSP